MFSLQKNLKFITINQDYLKYLHEACNEVYYKPAGYERKPYIGILLNENGREYVLPLSSAKEKHKSWKNIDTDRFLVYENCRKTELGRHNIYTDNADGSVKHILAIVDLKKMIPIKEGLYLEVNLNPQEKDSLEEKKYKVLLNIEYSFCLKIIDTVIHKASVLYDKQMKTGRVIPFCCDFRLLEAKCGEYTTH